MQTGHTVMRTSRTSRTVTAISRSEPHAHSTVTSIEQEASTSIISHNSGLSSSPESAQSRPLAVVYTATSTPWRKVWDSHYETDYYYNTVSGTSQWIAPTDISTADLPYDVSTQGYTSHEQPLAVGFANPCEEEALFSGNGTQISYRQEVSVTETVVHTHAEAQMLPSMLEATARETALTALSQTGSKKKTSKAEKKKKKKAYATSNGMASDHSAI